MENVIKPALQKGVSVICDRYLYSSVAYQGARGVNPRDILERNLPFALKPDVVILIELDIESALLRIASGRSGEYSVFEARESLVRVDEIYRTLNDPLIQRIDGSRSLQAIHKDVLRILVDRGLFNP